MLATKTCLAALAVAISVAVSGCAGAGSGGDLYAQLPTAVGSEVDPIESVEQLFAKSDLVVIGRITDVSAVEIEVYSPAPEELPEFVLRNYRIEFTVKPTGGGDPVMFVTGASVGAEEADAWKADLESARMPANPAVFALQGPYENWGYICTSEQMFWCPLEVRGSSWHSPRSPDWDEFTGADPLQPGSSVRKTLERLAAKYGFELIGK